MKRILLISLISLLQLPNALADAASHNKAAEELLELMGIETVLRESVNQMLKMQIQQNPSIAPYEQEMKAFLGKHMSWANLKGDMIKLYVAEFTEGELKEMKNFYQTPVGKKAIQKIPVLMGKGAELGQQRVQQNLPELQAAIEAKTKAQQPTP